MERKRRIKSSRTPGKVGIRIMVLEKMPTSKNIDKINFILSILSEAIPAGRLEKAQHRLKVKVNIPTAVYEKSNSARMRGSSGARLAGKICIKAWEKINKINVGLFVLLVKNLRPFFGIIEFFSEIVSLNNLSVSSYGSSIQLPYSQRENINFLYFPIYQ